MSAREWAGPLFFHVKATDPATGLEIASEDIRCVPGVKIRINQPPADEPIRLSYQSHSPTSKAAAQSLSPNWLAGKRLQVWTAILHAHDGLTDEEGIHLTGLSPSTYRPRRVELWSAGLVEDTGTTRPSASRRPMAVWRARATALGELRLPPP